MFNPALTVVFSEVIRSENKREQLWLIKTARKLWGDYNERYDDVEDWPKEAQKYLEVDFSNIYGQMPDWRPIKNKKGIVVFSKDGCSMNAVVPLVQLFLNRFSLDIYWSTTWAEINVDGMRPGTFGGGAVVVTAEEVQWFNVFEWVNNITERIELH